MQFDKLIIIGGGSSISSFDLRRLDHHLTFGLNFVCRYYEPTALIWTDRSFYDTNKTYIDASKSVKITRDSRNVPMVVWQLSSSKKYYGSRGLMFGLYHPYLTGLFALSLGVALDFKEIYLLGYDGKFIGGKSHFHDILHRGCNDERPYLKGNGYFEVYKNSAVKIINVSPESAIHVFPKITYEEFDKIIDKDPNIDQEVARKWLNIEIYANSKDYNKRFHEQLNDESSNLT